MATLPVGSLERLKELGVDTTKFGSCSEFLQRNVPNVGKVTDQAGCRFYHVCEWRQNTDHMQARDEQDTRPRPRHVKTRFVKPDASGTGDIVIDSYCTCYQWHMHKKRRHKQNRELVKVIGGEGDKVMIATSKKVVDVTVSPPSIVFEPDYKEVTIPRFPDPTENPSMKKTVFAAKAREQLVSREEDVEDARRLGMPEPENEGVQFVEMTLEEAKKIAGKTGVPKSP